MTPARARELLEAFTAFANGETIQCRSRLIPEWGDLPDGSGWRDDHEYRIKPKPRLRPWNPEEAPKFSMLRPKDDDEGKIVERVWHNSFPHVRSCSHRECGCAAWTSAR